MSSFRNFRVEVFTTYWQYAGCTASFEAAKKLALRKADEWHSSARVLDKSAPDWACVYNTESEPEWLPG